jgi:hypothetical protein
VGTMKSARIGVLLVVAAIAACETPRVDRVAASPSPYVDARPESGVGRISRECEAGKKLACYLMARAYEKGEAPVTAGGEIVVRNMHRAAYYHDKACALGATWSCYNLAEQYLKGDGVKQNSSNAARLYANGCNSRDVLDYPTGASCAALGDLYIKGRGAQLNFRTGLALLKKACAMGNEHGCKLHDIYGGTGLQSEIPGPEGALGFTFGWSKDDARAACVAKRGKWSTDLTGGTGERYFCDARVEALDHDGTMALEFIQGRLTGIAAVYDVDAGTAPKEFLRVGGLLTQLYGLPSDRVVEVLAECGTRPLADCISGKQASFSTLWLFKDGHTVTLSIQSSPNIPLGFMLHYESPEGAKAGGHQGL